MRIFLVTIACILTWQSVWAVNPTLSTIMPRGAQRGTEVEVTFHGGKLEDAQEVFFHDDGITVKEVKEAKGGHFKCVLAIAPDARLGIHRMRVRTATGITNLKFFSVGALKEVVEAEPNSTLEEAQLIELNSTVNGVVTSEDVDYFAVELPENSRLAVEVEGLRLADTLFDVKARLFSPKGHELVAEDDTALMQQDAAFVFNTTEPGKYVVALSESAYGGNGNCKYRVHIGNFPRPLAVTPMGVTKGNPVEVRWLGDPSIQKQTLDLGDVPLGMSAVLPQSEQGLAPTPIPFRVSEYPGVLEIEPNANKEQATPGQAPGAFDGVIQEDGDIDYFSFEGTKGQVYDVRVWARGMGSPLDSVMAVHAPSGKALLSNDDGVGLDSSGRITLEEDGIHTVHVHDQLRRGGDAFAYRIELTPIKPNLRTYLTKHDPVSMVVPKGNRAVMYVGVGRSDFGSPVQLILENLPAGIEAIYTEVPNGQSELPILLKAAADAPNAANRVGIKGVGNAGETPIEGTFFQQLPVVTGRNRVSILDTDLRDVALAVTEPAPFSIDIIPPKTPVIKASVKDLEVVITRSEGFDNEITVTMPFYPTGFAGGNVKIPKGETKGRFRVEARNNAPLGESKLIAVASSAGHSVATEFIPVNVEESWFTVEMEELRLEQGTEFQVPVKLSHAKEFEGEFQMELFRLPKGVTTANQVIKTGLEEVTFPITIAPDAPDGKHGNVAFSVSITKDGEVVRHLFTGKPLTVFKPLPPELQKPPPPPKPKEEVKKDEPKKPERRTRFPETQAQ